MGRGAADGDGAGIMWLLESTCGSRMVRVVMPSAEASTMMISWISQQSGTNWKSQHDDKRLSNKVQMGNGLVRGLTEHDSVVSISK